MWKSKHVRKLETDRDEAYAALRHMLDENTELAKRLQETEEQLSRAAARNVSLSEEIEKREKACVDLADVNRRLRAEKDKAIEELKRSLDKYRELRDRVEKLAHRVEELTGEMIGSVHEL